MHFLPLPRYFFLLHTLSAPAITEAKRMPVIRPASSPEAPRACFKKNGLKEEGREVRSTSA
jgi:hypothetical protein